MYDCIGAFFPLKQKERIAVSEPMISPPSSLPQMPLTLCALEHIQGCSAAGALPLQFGPPVESPFGAL